MGETHQEKGNTFFENITVHTPEYLTEFQMKQARPIFICMLFPILFGLLISWKFFLLILAFCMMGYIVSRVAAKRQAVEHDSQYGKYKQVRTCFFENSICAEDETDGSQLRATYDQIGRIVVTKRLYGLSVSTGAFLLIDRSGFTLGDDAQFLTFLQERIQTAKLNPPQKVSAEPVHPPQFPDEEVHFRNHCEHTSGKLLGYMHCSSLKWILTAALVVLLFNFGIAWVGEVFTRGNVPLFFLQIAGLLVFLYIFWVAIYLRSYGHTWKRIYGGPKQTEIYFLEHEIGVYEPQSGAYQHIPYNKVTKKVQLGNGIYFRYGTNQWLIVDKTGFRQTGDAAQFMAFIQDKCKNLR